MKPKHLGLPEWTLLPCWIPTSLVHSCFFLMLLTSCMQSQLKQHTSCPVWLLVYSNIWGLHKKGASITAWNAIMCLNSQKKTKHTTKRTWSCNRRRRRRKIPWEPGLFVVFFSCVSSLCVLWHVCVITRCFLFALVSATYLSVISSSSAVPKLWSSCYSVANCSIYLQWNTLSATLV